MQITGQVTEVREKQTKFGPMYDLIVNGTAYGHGKFAPRGIKEGDFVQFEVDVKQNGQYTNYNIRSKTLQQISNPTPEQKSEAKAQTSMAQAAANKKDTAYSRGASYNSALALIKLQLEYGGIKFPATAKPTAVYEAIDQAVLEAAAKLFKATTGDDWDVGTEKVSKPAVSRPAASEPDPADEGYDDYPDA